MIVDSYHHTLLFISKLYQFGYQRVKSSQKKPCDINQYALFLEKTMIIFSRIEIVCGKPLTIQ